MIKKKATWKKDGYIIRLAKKSDVENYFTQNYCPLDKEVARLTGCKESFSKEEVVTFFLNAIDADDRYFFLIISLDNQIIGESVINEIDWDLRCANFRIAIFHSSERGKGIGTWAIEKTRDFAFEKLKLNQLYLNVYEFNTRAQKAYLKAGFVEVKSPNGDDMSSDEILMVITEENWRKVKCRK